MPWFIDHKCLWTPYVRHGQILSAGTSSGGSTFQSSSFCQGIAVWVGLCMKYHVPWSSPTSMSSSVGQQLLQLQVCSNGCISSAHGIPKWISRFLVLWESQRLCISLFDDRGLSLSHFPSSDLHLLTCWLGLTSSSIQRPKTYRAVTFDPGSPTAWSLISCFMASSTCHPCWDWLMRRPNAKASSFWLLVPRLPTVQPLCSFELMNITRLWLTFCEKWAFPTWACWQHIGK